MSRPARSIDYSYIPGEEQNPLMESTQHVDWGIVLLNAARHVLADTDHLVTGNVAFAPDDGGPNTAPDIMVIPGLRGTDFGQYEPHPGDPLPSVCVEILSRSNTRAHIADRCRRLLRLGVGEVYTLDPVRETVARIRLQPDGETLIESSMVGQHSDALRLSFVRVDGRLAVCCPAGRVVRPGDDPFGWLVEEQARADAAASDAIAAREDAAAAREDAAAAREDAAAAHEDAAAAHERVRRLEVELARLRDPPS